MTFRGLAVVSLVLTNEDTQKRALAEVHVDVADSAISEVGVARAFKDAIAQALYKELLLLDEKAIAQLGYAGKAADVPKPDGPKRDGPGRGPIMVTV